MMEVVRKTEMDNPYPEAALNVLYQMLFCDHIALYKENSEHQERYPWCVLFSNPGDPAELRKLIDDAQAESRVKILACNLLREQGQEIGQKVLLGVIVEVGLDEGLDVLAAYRDGTVRYLNYSGRMIIWETSNETSLGLTNELFREGEIIVSKIGVWEKPRRLHPGRGVARLSFLVSDGLYFGEGPVTVLFNDPLAGPALMSATRLMQFISQHALHAT